uniref:RING-type domain-containing protein n=1 Tax=Leptobrachium leishanense TaxID=445787 RepID=A0A8C5WJ51_9ANUR
MVADHPLQTFNMTREALRGVPLNLFIVVFGAAFLLMIFCLIFCCYFLSVTILRIEAEHLCAVCLEDFKVKEELGLCPCNHAFHSKCLTKWLEVRNSCPMCNKMISVTSLRPSLERM